MATECNTNKSWIHGVYTSLNKANAEMLKCHLEKWHNKRNYKLTTQVLI